MSQIAIEGRIPNHLVEQIQEIREILRQIKTSS